MNTDSTTTNDISKKGSRKNKSTSFGGSFKQGVQSLCNTIKQEFRQDHGISIRTVLGGDILNTETLRRQIWFIILWGILALIYITNRYQSQQEIIEITELQATLSDRKFDALAIGAELTNRCRQSRIEEYLKENKDSMLKMSVQMPYVIRQDNQ